MDPLTAIGLVSNILSFIDFSARLLKGAKEVHDSHHGVLEENRSRETIMREMQRMSTRMSVSEAPEKDDENSSLRILASECRQLSTQLVSLLEKIKPNDSGSKTQSLLSAIRNKAYDSERESLEARLSDCRAQLHLELSSLTRSETLTKLESLVQASKADETKLDRIESHVEQLRENISSLPSSSEVKPMLTTLLAEEEKVFTTIAQDRILNCLSFEGMSRRSNMVVETHANTYEWILEDDSITKQSAAENEDLMIEKESDLPQMNEDVEKVRARDKLRTWLESETSGDVFHLSGKLGSGKSTLMKHIRASPRTEEKLNKWADGRKLTIANFYFWNIGSDYEKSLQGLYTSLLYQIFSQCPDFISEVWPSHWAQANSSPWLVPKNIEVSKRDVIKAFERVIKSDDMLKSHCFAFFIDGLDEFQSTVQDDHRDLVRLLCQWAASESGNIKICVSSREYPVFMDGFAPTLRIRFHDLTRRDMDTYIRDKLAHASAEDSFENLVSLIMNKADGVFLWVALVVKSLREGLENGLSCSDLTREVDILPDQLESLYRHILASLGKSSRRKAYQTFSMVTELKKQHYRMSLLAYSFFEEYEVGTSFFMKENTTFPIDSLVGDHGKNRAQSTSRKLAGWCKGLVEPYKTPLWAVAPVYEEQERANNSPCIAAWGEWSMELDFAHRSVSDFLASDDVQRDMQLNLAGFDPVDAVANLIVSDILFESSTSIYNTTRSGITNCVYLGFTKLHDLGREPYAYFRRVHELLAAAKPSDSMTLPTEVSMIYTHVHGIFHIGPKVEFLGESTATSEGESKSRNMKKRHYLSDPLRSLTVIGLCDYPLWHIANKPGFAEHSSTILSLACLCLKGNFSREGLHGLEPLVVLKALFERGWVSPDTPTNYRLAGYMNFWSEDFGRHSDLSLWQRFLMKMLSVRYYHYWQLESMDLDQYKSFLENTTRYDGRLLQLFLLFKQDTEFSFEILVDDENPPMRRDFLLYWGRHDSVMKLRTEQYTQKEVDRFQRPSEESEIGLPLQNGVPGRRHMSLREFVEHSWFDNKTDLLKMLDQKSEKDAQNEKGNATTAPAVEENDHMDDQIQPGRDGTQTRSAIGHLKPKLINNLELNLNTVSRWARLSLKNEFVRLTAALLTGVILTISFTSLREKLGTMTPG